MEQKKLRMQELVELLNKASKAYYQEATEIMSNYEYDKLYDGVFVWSMAMSDFFESSLPTEKEVALYVKDYVDDIDKEDGFVFNRWVADMYFAGIPIPWDEFI